MGPESSPASAASIWFMASWKFGFFKFLSVANWALVFSYENKSLSWTFALKIKKKKLKIDYIPWAPWDICYFHSRFSGAVEIYTVFLRFGQAHDL